MNPIRTDDDRNSYDRCTRAIGAVILALRECGANDAIIIKAVQDLRTFVSKPLGLPKLAKLAEDYETNRLDSRSIDELELGVRAHNALKNVEGILTLADLTARTETELLRIPNLGKVSLIEIKAALAVAGLNLAGR